MIIAKGVIRWLVMIITKVVGDDYNKGCTGWLLTIITKGIQGGW